MPIPVYTGLTYEPVAHIGYSAIAGLAVRLETFCLGSIAVGLRMPRSGVTTILIFVAIGALALQGIFAPAMSTTDPFDYLLALSAGWKTYQLDSGVATAGWLMAHFGSP